MCRSVRARGVLALVTQSIMHLGQNNESCTDLVAYQHHQLHACCLRGLSPKLSSMSAMPTSRPAPMPRLSSTAAVHEPPTASAMSVNAAVDGLSVCVRVSARSDKADERSNSDSVRYVKALVCRPLRCSVVSLVCADGLSPKEVAPGSQTSEAMVLVKPNNWRDIEADDGFD